MHVHGPPTPTPASGFSPTPTPNIFQATTSEGTLCSNDLRGPFLNLTPTPNLLGAAFSLHTPSMHVHGPPTPTPVSGYSPMPTPNIFRATTSEAWPSVLPPPHPEYACAWSADANPRVRILTNADTKHLWGYHERSTAQQLAVPRSPWRCLHTPSMHSPPMPTPASEYSPTPSGYHERSIFRSSAKHSVSDHLPPHLVHRLHTVAQ
ncbi:hypothetical protein EDB85DRAFT_2148795 [Lactarius pseudohatsudake]|nr:hypothetical protein EDB85DRAFT_2148795 [Lactarius pseudohatsudake]